MRVILENVRSFCGRHSIPIAPLTVLVGENSTGKSTLLAIIAHVTQGGYPAFRPSFNVPPFDLGTYDSIATFKGGRFGRAPYFCVGFSDDRDGKREVVATYVTHVGQPQLYKLVGMGAGGEYEVRVSGAGGSAGLAVLQKGRVPLKLDVDLQDLATAGPGSWFLRAVDSALRGRDDQQRMRLIMWFMDNVARVGPPTALALAPVRTEPSRTYDEIIDEFKPQGDHIPVLLARIWGREGDSRKAGLDQALREFGVNASLFKQIGVRHLGKRPSDPFQIMVTTAGPPANLLDVGYGVSQALPVVVQSVLSDKRRLMLLQQPEVHLHPRGQAALGSFFCHLVAKEGKRFVIETHSDYLLDRIRIEVANGKIPAKEVQILFFEREGIETRVHEIGLDDRGNILGAPPSYRSFFLKEENDLLSRGANAEPRAASA